MYATLGGARLPAAHVYAVYNPTLLKLFAMKYTNLTKHATSNTTSFYAQNWRNSGENEKSLMRREGVLQALNEKANSYSWNDNAIVCSLLVVAVDISNSSWCLSCDSESFPPTSWGLKLSSVL